MLLRKPKKIVSTILVIVVIAYVINYSGLTGDKIITSVQDPSSINWNSVGAGIVDVGRKIKEDVLAIFQGPVSDIISGTKDAMSEGVN